MAKVWSVINRQGRWCGTRPRCFAPMGNSEFWLLTEHRKLLMRSMPFRGLHAAEVWSKSWCHDGPSEVLLGRFRRMSVKKVKVADRASVKHLAALETELLRDHMAIVEHLVLLQYSDSSPRQTGYLGVWTQGSAWVARITDKDADATLTCEGKTLDEALTLLHMMLGAEDAPWEPCARKKRGKG